MKYPDLIHIEQDSKYIAWRVLHNPNIKYETYYAYHNRKLEAYCYLTITRNNEAYLSDYTFEDSETGMILLEEIIDTIRKRGIACIYFMGNIRNELAQKTFKLLKKNGFVKRQSSPFVLKNAFYNDESYLYNIKNWYINGLWTEGYTF
jgi:hypothetical protein